jgi:hypothetical protein
LLETIVGGLFDYLVAHPRLVRILNWEQAEGWQTYKKVFSQFDTEDVVQFEALFSRARQAGLLRSDFHPVLQLSLILQICISYLGSLPLYELELPDEDVSSPAALIRARDYLIGFAVAGIMADPGSEQQKT